MKRLFLLFIPVLFLGCSLREVATINGRKYTCMDLNKGIYKDENGVKYRLTYTIDGNGIEFRMVQKQ